MTIQLAAVKEVAEHEQRVALTPTIVPKLQQAGVMVSIQQNAGLEAGFTTADYTDVHWFDDDSTLQQSDVVVCVQTPAPSVLSQLKPGCVLIGLLDGNDDEAMALCCQRQISSFNLAWLPRITRAQSMDVLSSQAAAAGYQAALLAASKSSRFFPMLTTAAGTIRPATVLVIGAGVAGLQAIATAKRLGARVLAYDIRASVKEQVESLGAQMIDLGVDAEADGGYARELSDDEKQQQQATLAQYVAQADAVITTAAIPGRRAPIIVTAEMVHGMRAGSVLVDMAASSGGNCELTRLNEDYKVGGVLIVGPDNLAAQLAQDASVMYSRNCLAFLQVMLQEQTLHLNWEDEVLAATQLTWCGQRRQQHNDPLLTAQGEH